MERYLNPPCYLCAPDQTVHSWKADGASSFLPDRSVIKITAAGTSNSTEHREKQNPWRKSETAQKESWAGTWSIRLQGKTKVRREDHLSPGTANTPGMGSTWALIKMYFQPHLSFNKILSYYTGMWYANPMHPSPINNLLSVQDLTLLPPSVGSLTHIPTSHLSSLGLSHLSPLHPYFPPSVHAFCFLCLMPSAAWTLLGSQQDLWWSRVENKGLSVPKGWSAWTDPPNNSESHLYTNLCKSCKIFPL